METVIIYYTKFHINNKELSDLKYFIGRQSTFTNHEIKTLDLLSNKYQDQQRKYNFYSLQPFQNNLKSLKTKTRLFNKCKRQYKTI